jgi:broad specificity phosphatase PhoE
MRKLLHGIPGLRSSSKNWSGILLLALPALVQAQTTTVLVARHAERADAGGSMSADPPLSAAGRDRAGRLAEYLRHAGVSAVYTTQYVRTRETGEPTAKAAGIQVSVAPVERGTPSAAYVKQLAARILAEHKGQVVLVVGHSNTTPELVAALGAPAVPPIPDSDYGDLYIVQVKPNGTATLIRAKF